MFKKLFFIFFVCAAFNGQAASETFYMKDKSVVSGEIIDFHEDKFVVTIDSGGRQIIEKGDIEKIVFAEHKTQERAAGAQGADGGELLRASPQFESPIKTFFHWRKAALKADIEKMADCFVSFAREDQLAQLKSFSKDKIREMSKDTRKTDFSVGEPLYDGDKAYLSVNRKKGKQASSSILQFQKEGENWKMLPD